MALVALRPDGTGQSWTNNHCVPPSTTVSQRKPSASSDSTSSAGSTKCRRGERIGCSPATAAPPDESEVVMPVTFRLIQRNCQKPLNSTCRKVHHIIQLDLLD